MEENQLLLEEWKMASELHRHTNSIAWQSLNFFIAANSALLAVLGAVVISADFGAGNPLSLCIATVIPLAGVIISSAWIIIQKRQQLYQYYRSGQANRVEGMLKIDGKRVLTLYEKDINKQVEDEEDEEEKLITVSKHRRYLKTRIGKWRAHSLVVFLGTSLLIVWILLCLLCAGCSMLSIGTLLWEKLT